MTVADDAKAFDALFSVNLKKLPEGVLKAIGAAVRMELDKRRNALLARGKEVRQYEAATHKFFKGFSNSRYSYSENLLRYLDELISQNWSHLFQGDENRHYYVYMHVIPNRKKFIYINEDHGIDVCAEGMPFYVGKGSGERAFDLNRNQGHGAILSQLLKDNIAKEDIVCIVKKGMSEPEALELESKLIYFFGTKYEKGRSGILVNLDVPPRPELINPKRMRK